MNSTSRFVAVAAALLVLTSCSSSDELTERQESVAAAGAQVMPFNLDATTHIFSDTNTGGIQEVVADDPTDASNIEMIEQHLAEEASKFSAGDFSDPESIHGSAMPGLSVLKERFQEVDVQLSVSDVGATLTYLATEPEVVAAIHEWFAAQASDHGPHAEHVG